MTWMYLVPWQSQDGSGYKSETPYWPIKCEDCKTLLGYGGAGCSDDTHDTAYIKCLKCFNNTKKRRVKDPF